MSATKSLAEIQIGDIMTTHVVSVMADDSIQEVAEMMVDSELSTVPVINSIDKCVGILSRKDITEMFLQEDKELSRLLDTDRYSVEWLSRATETSERRSVREFMNFEVSTIHQNAKLATACQIMAKQKVHHLPVVNDNDTLVGVVSTFDVVNAVAHAAS